MPKIDTIINFIKDLKGFRFDKEVAEYLGMDNKTLATYKSRGELPQHYIRKLCSWYGFPISNLELFIKNIDNYNKVQQGKKRTVKRVVSSTEEKEKKEEMNYIVEAQKETIDLQKEKIERLEERIKHHKSTPIQSTVWDAIEHDYSVELSITFKNFKMGRTILKVNNIDRICDVLGYSKQEVLGFWDIGTMYTDFTAHPIDEILTKDTKKDIKSKVKALPNIFEALKDMLGNHYIPVPVTYICKDKSFVHSISYNKVDWKNKTVKSKVQFLLND